MDLHGGKREGSGRPKGVVAKSTQLALLQREYVIKRFEESLEPITNKAIQQAVAGDKFARDWLSDQSWGKPKQAIDVTSKGESINTADPKQVAIAQEFENKIKDNL